jgi:hypothetical protein
MIPQIYPVRGYLFVAKNLKQSCAPHGATFAGLPLCRWIQIAAKSGFKLNPFISPANIYI